MLHRAYFLLILLFLTLVSCGSHKMAGPSFGGDAELADWTPKEEGRKPEVSSTIEYSNDHVVPVAEVKSSNSIEVVEKQIHRVDDQKNVLVQPTHHRPILLLDSQAIDSNQLAFKKWTRVTNLGKWMFSVGLFGVIFLGFTLSVLGIFSAIFVLGLILMAYGSKKRHKYKPIIESHDTGPIPNTNTVSVPPIAESQNTGPTPNSNAVSESPELRVLRQKKDNLGLMCLMSSLFAFGILFMSELSGGGSSASENIIIVALLCILSFLLLIAFLQANMEFEEKRKALLEEAN
jgi:hypothetical protein